ncbi:MAG: DivIVA domain-containing protein [Clostridia bacterium]|nr:DivIVA domain-containing protein [Clostridia bacterium]
MLTPRDIDRKEFKRAVRGYNMDDVETFLMEISESYEELYRENLAAKERIALLSEAVTQYKSMEETLKNALAVAQRDGDDMKKAAREEADAIIRDAKIRAEEEISRLSYQYEQMQRSVELFRAKVVSLLNAQLDIIKEYGEPEPVAVPVMPQKPEVFEQTAPVAIPVEEQSTQEIPEIVKNEDGNYSSKE